jgi:hypothetical protein
MNLSEQQINDSIQLLRDADGEDLNYILKKIGMDNQLLKQLVMNASSLALSNCLEERTAFWINVPNSASNIEIQIKEEARKVWEAIYNNDTLIYNDFESYWADNRPSEIKS